MTGRPTPSGISSGGEPVVGELADSGITLEVLPVTLTTWGDWLKAHPDTMVLDAETGVYPGESYFPETSSRSIYFDYRQRKDAMFPVPEKSEALPPKSQVLGITFNGQVRAYPQEILDQEPVINDSLGGGDLVVVTPDDGGGSRVYHRSDIHFVRVQRDQGERGSILLIDNAAGSWRLEEDALVHTSDSSIRLRRLPSRTAYWFGWYSFYPNTEVFSKVNTNP